MRDNQRMMIRDLRGLQNTLDGVKLTCVRAIPLGKDGRAEPGEDLTVRARHWCNLATLIKRGDIRADPPVDYSRLVITKEEVKQEEVKTVMQPKRRRAS